LRIEGGHPLQGELRIHGAKNAALPILAATVLAAGIHQISNVPPLKDIRVMLDLLQALGCTTTHQHDVVTVDTRAIHRTQIPELLMRQMRSSIFLMGPLLARFCEVETFQPGGCAIGERKIDLHLAGLQALGAEIQYTPASVQLKANQMQGAHIRLRFPSVGATENIMMAAVCAQGVTVIENAACEPEIEDLQRYLNQMGADVSGAGTSRIRIVGVDRKNLHATSYHVMPDRIVAGTFMIAAVATKGEIWLRDVEQTHMTWLEQALQQVGASVTFQSNDVHVAMRRKSQSIPYLETGPYPQFPTDLQAQMMVLMALSDGLCTMRETIFERRLQHVESLQRMGANIHLKDNIAYVHGVKQLQGRTVAATDLRAGAAMILAGLAAQGTTWVESISHVDRGYDKIEHMIQQLGGSVARCETNPDNIQQNVG
jgi:UDP-N-acetylglucosamine 1-carboxyvinyltransferase